jgi:plasmid stability protein
MASITVRNIEDETKQALRQQAAQHGKSLEEEVRGILRRAAREGNKDGPRFTNLYDAIRDLVDPHGGFELKIPERALPDRDPPTFD